jgi:hypothetical protein
MRRRQTIFGALSAFAATVGGSGVSKAVFISHEMDVKCAEIRGLTSFEDFWGNNTAMVAFTHKDDPCHDVALDQYGRLQFKSGYHG